MIHNFKIIKVDSNYCDYLRIFDDKIVFNMDNKKRRPYVGILFKVNNFEYFAPLTSPKPKHIKMKNTIDFYKINKGTLGAINFNNMIPVMNYNYELIDLRKVVSLDEESKYISLLKEQLNWLNSNYIQIKRNSLKLYKLYYQNRLPENIKRRCCNFKLLEIICLLYNSQLLEIKNKMDIVTSKI